MRHASLQVEVKDWDAWRNAIVNMRAILSVVNTKPLPALYQPRPLKKSCKMYQKPLSSQGQRGTGNHPFLDFFLVHSRGFVGTIWSFCPILEVLQTQSGRFYGTIREVSNTHLVFLFLVLHCAICSIAKEWCRNQSIRITV